MESAAVQLKQRKIKRLIQNVPPVKVLLKNNIMTIGNPMLNEWKRKQTNTKEIVLDLRTFLKIEVHTTIVQFLYIALRIGRENKLESTYLLQEFKKLYKVINFGLQA